MLQFVKRWFTRAPETVVLDETGVTRTLPDGRTESIHWNTLREVHVVTTSDGPWATDLYWMLIDDRGGCLVPSDADCAQALLARLQALPGLDNLKLLEAMACTDDAHFEVWKRNKP